MLQALGFFALVEVVGLAAAPLAALVLGRLPGAGLGFAKPLGVLLLTWLVWLLAATGVAPYGTGLIAGAAAAVAAAGSLTAWRHRALGRRLAAAGAATGPVGRWRAAWIGARALPARDPARRPLWLGSELVFAIAYAAMALLVAYSPDVWGTEKPMDMAFVNAIDASSSFPPHDPWLAGADLNYYYLGHLAMALPLRVLGTAPAEGYDLALAVLFALAAASVFTLAGTLWAAARAVRPELRGGPVAAGLAAVLVCLVLGDLAGVKAWLDAPAPPGDYDWFAPSRVIPNTINEFPWFSFLLGDLHAHVLALPFVGLALAFAVQVVLVGPRGDAAWRGAAEALGAGLSIGALYAINSWSYPVAAGLLVLAALAWLRDPRSAGRRGFVLVWVVLVLVASVLLLLPFWLDFDPGARGLGWVHDHPPFATYLRDQGLIYGILAWLVLAAFAGRLLATPHPLRTAAWGATAAVFAGSLLATAGLAGPALIAAAAAVALGSVISRRLGAAERALWLLIAGGLVCVVLPDVVYVRDAFDGGPFYRMNTVFKFGYHGWFLLAVAGACALPWAAAWLPRRAWPVWAALTAFAILLGLVYPWAGTYARKDGFRRAPSLDGLAWLRQRAPGDVAAIAWLRARTPGDAVVLEAVGDDYSAFGHARISTFTGRATVLGWAGHEQQWSHDPLNRADEVHTLYTTTDAAAARTLIDRYRIGYVVVGPIERTDYGDAGVAKWDRLGRRVLDRDGTTVWALSGVAAASTTPPTRASRPAGSTAAAG
jgi:YYY domain-containing protein